MTLEELQNGKNSLVRDMNLVGYLMQKLGENKTVNLVTFRPDHFNRLLSERKIRERVNVHMRLPKQWEWRNMAPATANPETDVWVVDYRYVENNKSFAAQFEMMTRFDDEPAWGQLSDKAKKSFVMWYDKNQAKYAAYVEGRFEPVEPEPEIVTETIPTPESAAWHAKHSGVDYGSECFVTRMSPDTHAP